MSSWSAQRRLNLILTAVVILVFIVAGVLLAALYNPVSCTDGIRNGSETGVDCGGTCPTACPVEYRGLLDIWTRVFPVTPSGSESNIYAAVAYVDNPNRGKYVRSLQFEILLYDAKGSVVSRASDRTVIMPGAITPVFVPHINTGKSTAVRASFRFLEDPVFIDYPDPPVFRISDLTINVPEGEPPYVSAFVKHIGGSTPAGTDFVVIVYDEDDVSIAASRTFERYIGRGESRFIQFTWVHPFSLRTTPCDGGMCGRKVKRVEILPVVTGR